MLICVCISYSDLCVYLFYCCFCFVWICLRSGTAQDHTHSHLQALINLGSSESTIVAHENVCAGTCVKT